MTGAPPAVVLVVAADRVPAVVLAQAASGGLPWWAFVPSLVMLAFVVATAPIWPYSRGWGWSVAGMSAVGMFVAILFTLAWVVS